LPEVGRLSQPGVLQHHPLHFRNSVDFIQNLLMLLLENVGCTSVIFNPVFTRGQCLLNSWVLFWRVAQIYNCLKPFQLMCVKLVFDQLRDRWTLGIELSRFVLDIIGYPFFDCQACTVGEPKVRLRYGF
jgi:hypothetical protein